MLEELQGVDLRYDGANNRFSIDTSDVANAFVVKRTDGNVGIGTNNPGYPLQVYYAGGAGIGLQVKGTANRSKLAVSDNDTTAYVIAEDSYASFGMSDSLNANNLNINSNGSVGIGTVSPGAKLHVYLTGSAGSFSNIGLFRAGPDSNDSGAEIFVGQQGNSRGLVIRGGRGTGDQALAHFYLNQSGGTIPSTTQDHVMTFLQGGYVGIGTTNPGTYKLLVDGTTYIDDTLTVDGNINFESMGQYITFYGNNNAHHSISSRSSAGSANDDIRINTYGALFINLDSNGNDSSESHSSFQIGRHAGTGAVSASDLLLNLSGETGKLRLYKYGSGTHTGTAAYKLSVDSSGNVIETAIGAGAVDGSGTANYITRWTDTDTIGNSNIYDNGTIGIGTDSNLNGKVTIRGEGNSVGDNHIFCQLSHSTVGYGASIFLKTSTTNTNNRYGARITSIRNANNNAAADLAFSLENTGATALEEVVRFTSDGSVGIGITNPSSKLYVDGTTRLQGDTGIGIGPSSSYRLSVEGTNNTPARILSTATSLNLTLGNSTQTNFTNILFNSNSGNAQIWKGGGRKDSRWSIICSLY